MQCRMKSCPQLLPVLPTNLLGRMSAAYLRGRLGEAREVLEKAVGCRMCHRIGHSYDLVLAQGPPCLGTS